MSLIVNPFICFRVSACLRYPSGKHAEGDAEAQPAFDVQRAQAALVV